VSRLARRAVLKMAINKVKYGEYMISLLRSHTGPWCAVGVAEGGGRLSGHCPSGPIVVNRKLKTAIKRRNKNL